MKQLSLRAILLTPIALVIASTLAWQNTAIATPSVAAATVKSSQFYDPYSDYREVRYSNAGLLSESDEIKLGLQLHREVTKKFRLTDVGLARVEQLGQRCVKTSLRPNLPYRFHVIESREINGFSIPGGHIYVTTALLRLAT